MRIFLITFLSSQVFASETAGLIDLTCSSSKYTDICNEHQAPAKILLSQAETEYCLATGLTIKRSAVELQKQKSYLIPQQQRVNETLQKLKTSQLTLTSFQYQKLIESVDVLNSQIDWFNGMINELMKLSAIFSAKCTSKQFQGKIDQSRIDLLFQEQYNKIWR